MQELHDLCSQTPKLIRQASIKQTDQVGIVLCCLQSFDRGVHPIKVGPYTDMRSSRDVCYMLDVIGNIYDRRLAPRRTNERWVENRQAVTLASEESPEQQNMSSGSMREALHNA